MQIDVEPRSVRFFDNKSRRWRTRIGRRFARNYALGCFGVLAYVLFHLSELTIYTIFGLVLAFAFGAGVMAANWLFDFY